MKTTKAPDTLTSILKPSAFLLFIMLMACAAIPGCYRLEDEALQGRAPSIFYVEAFKQNFALYDLKGYPNNVTNFEKYEQMEPSYTYAEGTDIYFLLFMDDDLLHGYFSFSKLVVNEFKKEGDAYMFVVTDYPAFAPIGIQQLWGTSYLKVPGSTGDIYKYVFTVSDTDGNVSEPAEVVITVQ